MILTQEELDTIQSLNSEFTKLKISLGGLEIQKQAILSEVDNLRAKSFNNEQQLINKYGADSVINIHTGEVTKKTNEKV
jgi:hypothetical protein